MQNITANQLEQLQQQRDEVMSSKEFIDWAKSFNVGRLYTSKESFLNAREMNSDYNFSKLEWIGKRK